MVDHLHAGRPGSLPLRPDRPARLSLRTESAPWFGARTGEETRPGLLLLILILLMIPGLFTIAGSILSLYRVGMLVMMPWLLWRWLTGAEGRPTAVDILMCLSACWTVLSLVVNHGLGVAPRAVMTFVEFFGGYLIGRMLIRNRADHSLYFRYLTLIMLVLMPFAVLEMLTDINILRTISGLVFQMPHRQGNLGQRLGFYRAQVTLEHPILFGLVASMGVANVLYIFRSRSAKAFRLGAFFIFMVFTSLSSGPMLSVLIQMVLTVWDRTMNFVRGGKWVVFVYLGIFVFLMLRAVAAFSPLHFVIDHLMFNSGTAGGRLIILEYGTKEIIAHPIFGIGLREWTRPWYRNGTFDNAWLGLAMRNGLPMFLLMVAAMGLSVVRIVRQATLTPEEADYRKGYLITLAGLTVTLGTVYIWNATNVLVMIYIGAGTWFYTREGARGDRHAAALARRAAQASTFAEASRPESEAPSGGRSLTAPSGAGGNGARGMDLPGEYPV